VKPIEHKPEVAQVGIYANDGVKLMIENEWMEQPPWHPIEK